MLKKLEQKIQSLEQQISDHQADNEILLAEVVQLRRKAKRLVQLERDHANLIDDWARATNKLEQLEAGLGKLL